MRGIIVEREDGTKTITVYGLGAIRTAHSEHPNFAAIETAITSEDEPDPAALEELFNVGLAIERKFERLTDRITVRGDTIYLDMVPVHNALAEAILHTMSVDEDFQPLINFMERLESNPNPKSREALYLWLDKRNFTITPEGLVVGYKGVTYSKAYQEGEHAGEPVAGSGTGHAFVDGIEYGEVNEQGSVTTAARIPYPIGSVVEMPRSEVLNAQGIECGQGLHVGTYEFARSYTSGGVMLEVHVDPRDVVSVPNSESSSKFRTCRLKVVGTLESRYSTPVRYPDPVSSPFEDDEEPTDLDDMDFSGIDPDDEDGYIEPNLEPEIVLVQESVEEAPAHPSIEAFDTMLQRARRRRQSIVPYIENMTAKEGTRWTYSGNGDSTDRLNWKVVSG